MPTDKTNPDTLQNRRLIYGRRQGYRLHPKQARRVVEILPEFEPKFSASDLSGWFGNRAPEMGFDTYALEIGFGGGEHLAACAKAAPQTGFIGCEPFINGVAKLLGHIEAGGLENLCVHHGDARDVMAAMPACVLDQAFLLYPDPWPKKRHHKRRFVNQENLDSLFRVLAPNARLLVATDIAAYADWTLAEIKQHGGFVWRAQCRADWLGAPADWPGTRYEQKAHAASRVPHYLEFSRRNAPLPGAL
ncbi:MAG: tRNA (guanine(46)-N(7))-methyltransferase TrmB [Pseudomonadota bacterium]|nr:tRNA (guanine(46)-N(7))-methyltransferase TrmB [Pseudomonadota bacterium]